MNKGSPGVAAYVRVCDACPDRDEQELKIREKAKGLGYTIDSEFFETAGIASTDIVDRRVTLFEMLAAAQARRIHTVIAASPAVISNNPVEAAIIAIMLERSHCRMVFAEPFDIEPYRQEAIDLIEGRATFTGGNK